MYIDLLHDPGVSSELKFKMTRCETMPTEENQNQAGYPKNLLSIMLKAPLIGMADIQFIRNEM